ncbi:hypothetical protein [Actinoplanes sp. GCM10030250]|uniref:hypothetical protein n=1 Tax=Actinoplanes sp. GCM10030250 TaxID=3273376 RepID=UPI0036128A4D
MRLRVLFHRLALPAVAAGLALTGLALPAYADEKADEKADAKSKFDVPMVGIYGPETVTVISGQSKTVKIELINVGGAAAKGVVLEFGDAEHPVTADLGLTPPSGCTSTSCDVGDIKAGESRIVRFTLKPTTTAKVLPLTTVIGGLDSFGTSMAVVRTDKGGADLEMGDVEDLKLGRGGAADVPVVVSNTGNREVEAVALLVLPVLGGVDPVLDYRNCEVDDEFGGIVCVFNEPLAAGGTFRLPEATPLQIRVKADAPGPYEYPIMVAAVGLTEKYVFDFTARNAGAKGEVLKLEALARASADEPKPVEDLNEDDNFTDFAVSVPKSSADTAAVGGVFKGAVGDETTAAVGVRNFGPTALIPPTVENLPYLRVRVPGGIDLTEIDGRCIAGTSPDDVEEEFFESLGGRDYVCLFFDGLPSGEKSVFSFTGEILEGEHGAGKVTVHGGVQDGKAGNNTAAFTVELAAGGSGGGLPVTGAPAGLVAGAGAVLLVAGVLAYRMARRRRIVTVVE